MIVCVCFFKKSPELKLEAFITWHSPKVNLSQRFNWASGFLKNSKLQKNVWKNKKTTDHNTQKESKQEILGTCHGPVRISPDGCRVFEVGQKPFSEGQILHHRSLHGRRIYQWDVTSLNGLPEKRLAKDSCFLFGMVAVMICHFSRNILLQTTFVPEAFTEIFRIIQLFY